MWKVCLISIVSIVFLIVPSCKSPQRQESGGNSGYLSASSFPNFVRPDQFKFYPNQGFPDFTKPPSQWSPRYPDNCEENGALLDGMKLVKCVEQAFWMAFQYGSESTRRTISEMILKAAKASRDSSDLSYKHKAALYFRHGLLKSAIMVENAQIQLFDVRGAWDSFAKANELDPENYKIDIWLQTFRLFGAVNLRRDYSSITNYIETELLPKDPMFVLFALIPVYVGLPLDTGLPQKSRRNSIALS